MGLVLDLYRSGYDSPANLFYGKNRITVVNADATFEPTPDAPAAMIVAGAFGDPIIRPVDIPDGMAGPMMGGTYAATSDGRLADAMKAATGRAFYGALAVHDRVETWADYYANLD